MKIFYFTLKENVNDLLVNISKSSFSMTKINSEDELFEHDFEKCILIIDIDTLKDHGFTLATKLSMMPNRKAVIIGVTTLDVDSSESKFDFFFDSLESVKKNINKIVTAYEKI